jgi:DNA-binding NtrC family response regulator
MNTSINKLQIVLLHVQPDVLAEVNAQLNREEFEVICFSNSEVAYSVCLTEGQNWDLLITNTMTSMKIELEIINEIKKLLPDLPVLNLFEPDKVSAKQNVVPLEIFEISNKSIRHSQILEMIEIKLARKVLTSPTLNSSHITNASRITQEDKISETKKNAKKVIKIDSGSKIIGLNAGFANALSMARKAAKSNASILITGESGTGKEIFAKFIHDESSNSKGPFVAINCSAIPENLLESELFGHSKGAFTGAQEKRIGLFEEAQGGSLFLDEIGDLNLALQAKLLRVLQEKKIKRVGDNIFRPINCRIISATHKDLLTEVSKNTFREDLYFRLDVIPIYIPPLRDRVEDLIPLAEYFLNKYAFKNHVELKRFSHEALEFITSHKWRGNVRELENMVERAVAVSSSNEIVKEDFMPDSIALELFNKTGEVDHVDNVFYVQNTNSLLSLDDVIQKYIHFAIEKNCGARDKTAKEIGIDRKTLYNRMRIHA